MQPGAPLRILMTGYSGFVGGYLRERCLAAFPEARLFGLSEHDEESSPAHGAASLEVFAADMTDAGAVRRAVAEARPDLIFHLAALSSVAASWQAPERTLAVNAGGTIHLLEAVRHADLEPRVLLIGSGEQYGLVRPEDNPISEDYLPRPANPYAVSKVAQDLYGYQYFAAFGLPIVRVRAFNHIGPRQASTFVVASFASQIARIEAGLAPPLLLVGNLDARRDFLAVEDVTRAYVALARDGHAGEAYNVGSGQGRAIGEVLDMLLGMSRVHVDVERDPKRMRPADVPVLVADTTKLQAHTSWRPEIPLEEALRQTLAYWRRAYSPAS